MIFDYCWAIISQKLQLKSFFSKNCIFYIDFNTVPTYSNIGVSWDSWHFLLKNVSLSHTCISVFIHLPFFRQHIRAPLCKKPSEYIPKNLNYDQNTKKCPNLPRSPLSRIHRHWGFQIGHWVAKSLYHQTHSRSAPTPPCILRRV